MVIYQNGLVTIWQFGNEFPVYRGDKLIRTCPSIGMAREVASGL